MAEKNVSEIRKSLKKKYNKLPEENIDGDLIEFFAVTRPDLETVLQADLDKVSDPVNVCKTAIRMLGEFGDSQINKILTVYSIGAFWNNLNSDEKESFIKNTFEEFEIKRAVSKPVEPVDTEYTWAGFRVPPGYKIESVFLGHRKMDKTTGEEFLDVFCNSPGIVTATGTNIDDGKCWIEFTFRNISGKKISEWLPQQEALSKRGIMALANRGLNLVENKAADMNQYISKCMTVNSETLDQKIVTEKNGWKCDNSIFAFGTRGFQKKGKVISVIPLRAKQVVGLRESGTLEDWIDAVSELIKIPQLRFKFYAVAAAPLLRLLNVQSFIVDHNGETSEGKTSGFNAAISMFGNPDQLRFNGDTTKTAAEVLAETNTDLPLFLDETGTQQSDEVIKTIVYMLANEQGRMRGQKDGGLRETGTWKTIALTTGEKPLTSSKSFSGQLVRILEIRGTLGQGIGPEIKRMSDGIKQNYGHIAKPYFDKVFEYMARLPAFYECFRGMLSNTNSNTGDRMADSYAVLMVAGLLLEELFSEIGIEPIEPHEIIFPFFQKGVGEGPIENYSARALGVVMDWVQSKNSCFVDADNPTEQRSYEFYGWIDRNYIDILPTELGKVLDKAGFSSTRVRNDWKDEGLTVCSGERKDFNTKHNGKDIRVIRLVQNKVKQKLGL